MFQFLSPTNFVCLTTPICVISSFCQGDTCVSNATSYGLQESVIAASEAAVHCANMAATLVEASELFIFRLDLKALWP
ncbi:hypothetical protein PIIN_06785 [Serendipita indica DSM 11827]|uniref:Uncharacterized protein n=1 Tax=Serendipita indica (strain DSM 11827) TaxID=1109443 RepID=G4TNG8_SERID|nr:hypothetical protein PIIN_06785 [Serendipita indica DSM 11827]